MNQLLIFSLLAVVLFCGCGDSTTNQAKDYKRLVETKCSDWKKGRGSLFDLLSRQVEWTVAGGGPQSGRYQSKQLFLDSAVQPITSRLSTPIKPTVRSICADGNEVVVLWDGESVAKDGKPYRNTYSWHLTFRGDSVVKVVALLDTYTLADLMARPVNAPDSSQNQQTESQR